MVVGLGAFGGGEAEGAPAAGGLDGVPPLVPPPELGGPGTGGLGEGEGEGEGAVGVPGVPPTGDVTGPEPRPGVVAGPVEMKIGVKLENGSGAAGLVTTCGRPGGETSTGTLRACVLGIASPRVAECSSTVKACSQSWADATAPAATAPT